MLSLAVLAAADKKWLSPLQESGVRNGQVRQIMCTSRVYTRTLAPATQEYVDTVYTWYTLVTLVTTALAFEQSSYFLQHR